MATGDVYIEGDGSCQMAKAMGYEVYFVEGGVLSSSGYLAPHGWVEIMINGSKRILDSNFHNETGLNGYLIWYGKSGTWRYSSYHRVA